MQVIFHKSMGLLIIRKFDNNNNDNNDNNNNNNNKNNETDNDNMQFPALKGAKPAN